MKRKFVCFCIASIVTLAFSLGVFSGISIPRINATTIIVDVNQTLFMRNGTHNAALRVQLINFANSIPAIGEPNGRQNVDVGGISHIGADANVIRIANGGDMPIIRIFEQRQDSVITGGSSQTLEEAADNFTMQQWMLMYITFPVNGHPIFTFMMTNPYRNQRFNPLGTDLLHNLYDQIGGGVGNLETFMDTEGSEIRNQINYDFGQVLYQFSYVNPNVFTTPAQLPGTWQSREPDVNSPNREFHRLEGARLDDRIWLPSSFELGDGNLGNLWNVTRYETAKLGGEDNGFHMWAWMRSRTTGNADSARMFSGRDYSSHFSNSTISNPRGVRPALHLDLTSLIPALETPTVNVIRSETNQITASWGAVTNSASYRVRVNGGNWQTATSPFTYTIISADAFNVEVYAVGDNLNFVNSGIGSASISVNREQLVAPTNLQINEGVLTWDSTDSLGTYAVYRNNTPYSTELSTRTWTIPTTWTPGTWNLQVRATAPSSHTWFTNSNLSSGTNHIIQNQNFDYVLVDGLKIDIVPGVFYLIEHLTVPTVQDGYRFIGWSADGGVTILKNTDALESGMVLTSVIGEITNDNSDFPWLIIVGAVAGVVLIAGVIIAVLLWHRKRPKNA